MKRDELARRTEETRDRSRETVLAAARAMIEEEGPGAITARALARRVGLLPGSLYNLFPSIEEIRLLALGAVLSELGDALAAIPLTLPPARRLHAYAAAYIEFMDKNANSWLALLDYRRNATAPAPDWYLASIARLVEMIARCFCDLSPQRSPEEARLQARLLWAGMYGLTALAGEGRLETVMAERFDILVERLVDSHLAAFA